jgi:hypothetical protein
MLAPTVRSRVAGFLRHDGQVSLFLVAAAALLLTACGSANSTTGKPVGPTPNPSVTVTVAPTTANIRAGATLAFTATVANSSNTTVSWSVNNIANGNSTLGTIDASGNYTAPASLPTPNTITISAASQADNTATASSNVTLLNPTPVLTGINPSSTNLGAYTITVTGSAFINGAQVLLNSAPLPTTFVSSTQLTATGTASSAGAFSVAVQNPDPGSSTSSTLTFQVNGSTPPTNNSACNQMSTGAGASLNGFLPFPSDNLWNQNIASSPVDPNSAAIINYIGSGITLHPDFGQGEYNGSYIGIPYAVVDGTQPLINITYNAYGSESDQGPMPIPLTANVEGYPNPGNGDRHVLVLDSANCFLYELYGAAPASPNWTAGSGAVWDLLADEQRPYTWTSADAAGLPIFPGLVRYDEVASGAIHHAIRFTLQNSRAAFVLPATHWASTTSNANAAPMGMRLRLKASTDISSYSTTNQVILNAMKQYGLIMADNGSSMYISGAPDERWNNDDLHNLDGISAGDFEVIQMSTVYTAANVPTGNAPQISQFSASQTTVSSGTTVTLSWQTSGASYVIVSPQIGATRATSATVNPTATTTYTLYATNAFGQTTSTVTITVH